MFDINIKFIILSLNIEKDSVSTYILSSDKNSLSLPTYSITTNDSIENIKKLCFENYVSLKLEWIEHKLLDIVKNSNIIDIYYVCSIPIESKLTNGSFVPLNMAIFDPMVQKAARFI